MVYLVANSKLRLKSFLNKRNEIFEFKTKLHDLYDKETDLALGEIFSFIEELLNKYPEIITIEQGGCEEIPDELIGFIKRKTLILNIKPDIKILISCDFIMIIDDEFQMCGTLHIVNTCNTIKTSRRYVLNALDSNWYPYNGKAELSTEGMYNQSIVIVEDIIEDLVTLIVNTELKYDNVKLLGV